LHLAHEELAPKKEEVGEALGLVDVAKGGPCLGWSLAMSNVCNLPVHKVDGNESKGLLLHLLKCLLGLWNNIFTGRLLTPIHHVPAVL